MIVSNNTIGNPYHDEEGKFTSPDAAALGVSLEDFLSYSNGLSANDNDIELLDDIDIDSLLDEVIELRDDIDIDSLLDDVLGKKGIQIPFTLDETQVKENFFEVLNEGSFVDNLINHINFNEEYIGHKAHTKCYTCTVYGGKEEVETDFVIYSLVYALYPKKAQVITKEEYEEKMRIIKTQGCGQLTPAFDWKTTRGYLVPDDIFDNIDSPSRRNLGCGFIPVYRGISLGGASFLEMKRLKMMYSENSEENPILGSSWNNSGSTHYFSTRNSYAEDYSSFGNNGVIKGFLDLTGENKEVRIIKRNQLRTLCTNLRKSMQYDRNFEKKTTEIFKEKLRKSGVSEYDLDTKAKDMYECVLHTLNSDWGFAGLLSGAQIIAAEPTNGAQMDLYDLSLLKMIED